MISSGKVKQRALTIITPILPGKTGQLREFLQSIGSSQSRLGLLASSSTHFARFVVVTDEIRGDRLVFTSNYDEGPGDYLQELAKSAGPAMDSIWRFCAGYQAGDALESKRWANFVNAHERR